MIRSKFYDVEILKNFFSITIIDITSYLETMKDICDEKGNPIPLVQKLTVAEIKERLDSVKFESYYITDTDDSQLFSMLKAISDMRPHYEKNDNGNDIPVTTHMYGYNSGKYDKFMIAALLMHHNNVNGTKELIKILYETSQKIIQNQNEDRSYNKNDFYINALNKFKLPYTDIDIMQIFALNKASVVIDKNGERKPVPKSLKQTSINLQWYELLEFELPPICEKDVHYYHTIDRYKGMTIPQLNSLIAKWERFIIDEYIPPMMYYNKNDCFIGCEMIRLNIDEIRLRYNIARSYGLNVLSASRSNISDAFIEKFYSEMSGLHPSQWKGRKTERKALAFKKVIFDFINFKTEPLQKMLREMKDVVIYSIGKDAFSKEISINDGVYTIATGGLHSKDIPGALYSHWPTDDASPTGEQIKASLKRFKYVHWDISSFYPSIMVQYGVAPAHLDQKVFVKLIKWMRDTRVTAKHTKGDIDGVPANILAAVLKIVINAIYGKLGFEKGDLCDRLAVLKVTINGQLMIMMLCEELELNGIKVISANTDGIVVKLYEDKIETFNTIADNWKQLTGLDADSEEYKCYINRDINNYIIQEFNGKITYKGALHPKMYLEDLKKGYDMPIVAEAIVQYFLNKVPVMDTLYKAKNILDFCKTQNIGKQFHVEETIVENGNIIRKVSQRNCRFYVSNNGTIVEKVNPLANIRNKLCAGYKCTILNSLDDKDISLRDINYQYYFNEAMKIINPIKLGISPSQKGDPIHRTKSGKALLKKYSGITQTLFDKDGGS